MKLKSVDWSELRFSEKKLTKNPKGTDNVFITYGPENKWLYVQLPLLRMPFEPQENEDGSIAFTLSLDKNNPRHAEAIEKLRSFDVAIEAHLDAHSVELVNKAKLDDRWKSDKLAKFLKVKLDDDDPSIEKYHNIKVKLPAKDGQITTVGYEWTPRASGEPSEIDVKDYLLQHCHVEAIVRPARIWFQKTGKVGTTFTADFVRIKPAEDRNAAPRFVADSDEEDVPAPAAAPVAAPPPEVSMEVAAEVVDEEAEEVLETEGPVVDEPPVLAAAEDEAIEAAAEAVVVKAVRGRGKAAAKK